MNGKGFFGTSVALKKTRASWSKHRGKFFSLFSSSWYQRTLYCSESAVCSSTVNQLHYIHHVGRQEDRVYRKLECASPEEPYVDTQYYSREISCSENSV